jgi:hypothetical protein
VENSFECGNEPSGSIQCSKFLSIVQIHRVSLVPVSYIVAVFVLF